MRMFGVLPLHTQVGKMREELIQSDPAIMMGKPVIAGTRIAVELILEKLAAGETIEQILAAHPRLTREAIQAAGAFAARVLRAGCRLSFASVPRMNLLVDEFDIESIPDKGEGLCVISSTQAAVRGYSRAVRTGSLLSYPGAQVA